MFLGSNKILNKRTNLLLILYLKDIIDFQLAEEEDIIFCLSNWLIGNCFYEMDMQWANQLKDSLHRLKNIIYKSWLNKQKLQFSFLFKICCSRHQRIISKEHMHFFKNLLIRETKVLWITRHPIRNLFPTQFHLRYL